MQRFVVEKKDHFRSKNYLILTLDVFHQLSIRLGASARQLLESPIKEIVGIIVDYYKSSLTLVDEL